MTFRLNDFRLLLAVMVSETCPVSEHLGNGLVRYFVACPPLRIGWCFSHDKTEIIGCGEEDHSYSQ